MAGYPVGEAISTGWLAVGDGHELYWEEAGNPDGVPALTEAFDRFAALL